MEGKHNKYGSARDKLHEAMVALVGPQDQRVRLKDALWPLGLISHPDAYEKYLPSEVVHDFRKFMEKMIALGESGSGDATRAILHDMSDDAVNNAAQEILAFYRVVCHCG